MSVSAQEVKKLRDRTGVPLMDCKRALVEANGDMDKAVQVLRKKGKAKAQKKKSRETGEGVVGSYVHGNDKLGVLVEVACETDFVARSDEFQDLVKEIGMQIAAMDPMAVSRDDLPEEEIEKEKEVYSEQFKDKPDEVVDRIVEGKLEKYYQEVCLLDQPYIRDDSMTVGGLINDAIAKLGENIEVRRFTRMEVGGGEGEE